MRTAILGLGVFLLASCWPAPAGADEDRPAPGPNARPGPVEQEWVSGTQSSVPVLVRYLRSTDPVVVRGALHDLATRGTGARTALPEIRRLLRAADPQVAIDAAWTLVDLKVDPRAALERIVSSTRSRDSSSRAYAARALGDIVKPPLTLQCWGPGPRPSKPRPELARHVVPALARLLRDPQPGVRAAAVKALGQIGREARPVYPAVLGKLTDDATEVRLAASVAVYRIDPEAAARAGVD